MDNQIKPWKLDELSENNNEFFIDGLVDNSNGLQVSLSDNKKFSLKFIWLHDELISYRNTNREYFIYGLGQEFKQKNIRQNFYKIENSEYIKFIKKWSYPETIRYTKNLIHFAIYTVEDCLDIISTSEPKVKFKFHR